MFLGHTHLTRRHSAERQQGRRSHENADALGPQTTKVPLGRPILLQEIPGRHGQTRLIQHFAVKTRGEIRLYACHGGHRTDYRRHRFWSTQTGTRSLTTPALSSSATLASMVLEPHVSRSKRTALHALLFSSAALPSSLSDTGPRSISRVAASSGVSSASEDNDGVLPSASFRTTRRTKASPRLPSTTPESRDARIFHSVPL